MTKLPTKKGHHARNKTQLVTSDAILPNTAQARRDSRIFQNINFGSTSNSRQSDRKVTFWAGLRVEGELNRFEIKDDDLTKWNDKINNGGLFEKMNIGGSPKNN